MSGASGDANVFFFVATAFYTYPLVARPEAILLIGLGDHPTRGADPGEAIEEWDPRAERP
jgi:hypothetical protein